MNPLLIAYTTLVSGNGWYMVVIRLSLPSNPSSIPYRELLIMLMANGNEATWLSLYRAVYWACKKKQNYTGYKFIFSSGDPENLWVDDVTAQPFKQETGHDSNWFRWPPIRWQFGTHFNHSFVFNETTDIDYQQGNWWCPSQYGTYDDEKLTASRLPPSSHQYFSHGPCEG